MNSYEVYCEYVSIKRHFADWKYDYFRYGSSKIKPDTFDARNDMLKFKVLSRRSEPVWTMAATLARKDDAWIGDMVGDEARDWIDAGLGRVQSIGYWIDRELSGKDPKKLLSPSGGRHPGLITSLLAGKVSHEVAAVVISAVDCVPAWRAAFPHDPVIESLTRRMHKYFPFLKINAKEAKKRVVQVLSSGV